MGIRRKLLIAGGDVALAAAIMLGVWVTGYRLPQKGISVGTLAEQLKERFSGSAFDSGIISGADSGSTASGIIRDSGKAVASENSLADIATNAGNAAAGSGTGAADAGSAAAGSGNSQFAGITSEDLKRMIMDSNFGNKTDITSGQSASGNTDNAKVALEGAGINTAMVFSTEDWHKKFADKFTSQVVSTQDSYTSPNLSIHLTHDSYDSGIIDTSENGKHKKYGSKVAYTVADIYIGDITCFQTAFAQDIYGVGYEETLSSMSDRVGSVLAVNGDSYSNNRHKDNGTIIRNGVIYRAKQSDAETCVLNWDGTMKIYDPGTIDENQLIADGAYQSWVFGPSLLDANGKAKTSFTTWDYIRESHPRTAIGYYEPGHYCLLLADGRQADYSRGMFPEEMAAVFEKLGCKLAYNLDGGHCSFMTFQGKTANHPYKPDHTVQDGIFLTEGLA